MSSAAGFKAASASVQLSQCSVLIWEHDCIVYDVMHLLLQNLGGYQESQLVCSAT